MIILFWWFYLFFSLFFYVYLLDWDRGVYFFYLVNREVVIKVWVFYIVYCIWIDIGDVGYVIMLIKRCDYVVMRINGKG